MFVIFHVFACSRAPKQLQHLIIPLLFSLVFASERNFLKNEL